MGVDGSDKLIARMSRGKYVMHVDADPESGRSHSCTLMPRDVGVTFSDHLAVCIVRNHHCFKKRMKDRHNTRNLWWNAEIP